MKAGWQEIPLGQLCKVQSGSSNTQDAIADGPYTFFDRSKKPKRSGKFLFDCEALIIAGEGAEFRPKKFTGKFDLHQRAYAIHGFGEHLLGDYLYYYLEHVHEYFQKVAVGATVKSLRQRHFDNLPVLVPPIEEQRRIVAVLDEAFAATATATANTEKNLANARELFDAAARTAFDANLTAGSFQTAAVEALAVARKGSMRTGPFGSQLLHSEFVDDGVAVLGIDNAVDNDFRWGKRRFITEEKFQSLSRFLVYPGDVIITIMGTCGRCAVIPNDIPRAINSKHLFCISLDQLRCMPAYLHAYFLHAPDARAYLEERAQGSIMAGLNMGIIREMPVRLPALEAQQKLVKAIEAAKLSADTLTGLYQKKLEQLAALKQSLLHRAFTGELKSKAATIVAWNDNLASPEFAAKIVAFAYERHVAKNRVRNFGTVKAEKILHMVEAIGGIDLGRQPFREAAGPDDAKHRHATWDWARSQQFFRFNKRSSGGHDFEKLSSYPGMIEDARTAIVGSPVEKAIELLVDMDRDFAELIATTYAAWNNLIIDQCAATDGDIVRAARDNWHRDKLRFAPSRFHDAIRFIRNNSIVPDGTAKRVGGQEALLF